MKTPSLNSKLKITTHGSAERCRHMFLSEQSLTYQYLLLKKCPIFKFWGHLHLLTPLCFRSPDSESFRNPSISRKSHVCLPLCLHAFSNKHINSGGIPRLKQTLGETLALPTEEANGKTTWEQIPSAPAKNSKVSLSPAWGGIWMLAWRRSWEERKENKGLLV